MATNNSVNTNLSGQTGTGSFVGSTAPTVSSNMTLSGTVPQYRLNETDGGVDEKNWMVRAHAAAFTISTASDATPGTVVQSPWTINRSGTAVSNMNFSVGGSQKLYMDSTYNRNFNIVQVPHTVLGASSSSIDLYRGDGTSAHTIGLEALEATSGNVLVEFFRNTNTSGTANFFIYNGDNTATVVLDTSRSGLRLGGANARVSTILTDGTMAAASTTNLYTGSAIKTYVDSLASKVVQWVSSTSSTDDTSTSSTLANSSLTGNITPTSASNRIVVMCYAPVNFTSTGSIQNYGTKLAIRRSTGTPAIITGGASGAIDGHIFATARANDADYGICTIIGTEIAPSTSMQTYTLQFARLSPTGGTSTISGSTTGPAFMLLMELKV